MTFCKVRHGGSVTKPDYKYYYLLFIITKIQNVYLLHKKKSTLSLSETHICINFSIVYNDMLVAKGLKTVSICKVNELRKIVYWWVLN